MSSHAPTHSARTAADSAAASAGWLAGRRPTDGLEWVEEVKGTIAVPGRGLLQRKLSMGRSGAPAEAAADQAADAAVAGPEPPCSCGGTCGGCASGASAEDDGGGGPPVLRRMPAPAPAASEAPVPPAVDDALSAPGRPLASSTRQSMEGRFAYDFSQVRIHSGDDASARSARSARAVHALAYTVGNDIVFAEGQYQPDTAAGRRLLAHELAHVVQQGPSGLVVQRTEDPRSLYETLDPTTRSVDELSTEIRLLTEWLARQIVGTEQTIHLTVVLASLQAELNRRQSAGGTPGSPSAPPPPGAPSATPETVPPAALVNPLVAASAPAYTTVASAEGLRDLQADPATRQRLLQIISQGGPLPTGTRVIGAAIVQVEGYAGAREIRAISSAETDVLGQGAPIFHATTPSTRTLTAARNIGGTSGDWPGAHVNDAEIKLFEYIAANLPAGARGRISFMTMRIRQGALEPIAACSSCTHALFQVAGRHRGVEIGSYAPARPQRTLDLGGRPPGPGSPGGAPSTQVQSQSGGLRAEVGTPDMRGLQQVGPSARGVGIAAGLQLAFMGVNFIANWLNDREQQRRAQAELDRLQPGLLERRRREPNLGVLLVFFYTRVEAPSESLIQPGAVFGRIEVATGLNLEEARANFQRTPALRSGLSPRTAEIRQEQWIPPIVPAGVTALRTPFSSVALGRFADGRRTLQDVEWGGITGFDDETTTSLGSNGQFLILQVPRRLWFLNGPRQVNVDIPVESRAAHAGGSIPVVNLDPVVPGNVSAACLFPADDDTDALFATAPRTHDTLDQLRHYVNFHRVRWARPEDIDVIRRI